MSAPGRTPAFPAPALTGDGPVPPAERAPEIDIVRGIALGAVLIINLVQEFRVPLSLYLQVFHTGEGALDAWTDRFLATFLESKAFAIFSLLFGVGLAVQHESGGGRVTNTMCRRLLGLLILGMLHMTLLFNGDILTVYAVVGALVLPFARWPPSRLVMLAIALLGFYCLPLSPPLPHGHAYGALVKDALVTYPRAGFFSLLSFRFRETREFIVPLEVFSVPRIAALFLLGMAAWKTGVARRPADHTRSLRRLTWTMLPIGLAATLLCSVGAELGWRFGGFAYPLYALAPVVLGLGYAVGLTLLATNARAGKVLAVFRAAGRLSLTNYIGQSIIFGTIFYGFGAGQMGRWPAWWATVFGLLVFAAQVAASNVYLRRSRQRFGPIEWLLRRFAYGRAPLARP